MVVEKLPTIANRQDKDDCTALHYLCESSHLGSEEYVHTVLAHCAESLSESDKVLVLGHRKFEMIILLL